MIKLDHTQQDIEKLQINLKEIGDYKALGSFYLHLKEMDKAIEYFSKSN